MPWIPVHAGRDYLAQYQTQGPVEAVAELVWNALDAEADLVDIEVESESFESAAGNEVAYVSRITITDTGHGIAPDIATRAFPSLGDSWKKTLGGRTLNALRPLHGSKGRGRFFAYSLGTRVTWESVSEAEAGVFQRIEIVGNSARIDGFTISEPSPADRPAGTTLHIEVEQGRPLAALLNEGFPNALATILAPYLLGNEGIMVRVNGVRVDPLPLIEGEPRELTIADVPPEELGDTESPSLMIVDWTDKVHGAPGIVLCTREGPSLYEVPNSTPGSPKGNVRSTGYLRWSGWEGPGVDFLIARMNFPNIVEAAIDELAEHVRERVGTLKATIVKQLKDENAYPYPERVDDPVRQTEQQVFDLVVVTARGPLRSATKQQRALSVQLLQVALQERPESLDRILGHALALTPVEREELADLLRLSSLGAIIGAATEVSHRLDLISTFRHLIYGDGVAKFMREVDQLHPLVKGNCWLFGEEWKLSDSEAGITTIQRQVLREQGLSDTLLEEDLLGPDGKPNLSADRRGRVDLLLQRTIMGNPDHKPHRLVVELKRPSTRLGEKELAQVKRYARALAKHPGSGEGRWYFWLIGSDYDERIEDDVAPRDRARGHVTAGDNYDIWLTKWGDLLNDAQRRLDFYREQLAYTVSQDQAVERVRQRHRELLPDEPEAGDGKETAP